ncbi:MAG: LamG domain-containing protein [Candidatus Pacebacteria bacterium]|nr:LamG domain-containing protein [Candidatus Paceibacterota bacterium]
MNKSFTLIEILVVIVIIGILSAFIIVGMAGVSEKATIAKGQAFSSSLKNALMLNLVSEWRMDDASGTNVKDYWDSNDGTWSGPVGSYTSPSWRTASECVSGGCLAFDGTDDYIDCGAGTNLSISTTITVGAWIKFSSVHFGTIISKEGASSGYMLFVYSDGAAYFQVFRGASWAQVHASVSTNQWAYLTGVYNGSNTILYINGVAGTPVAGSGSIATNSNRLAIGVISPDMGLNYYFNGLIDDVRIYNQSIPTSQIQQNYYSGLNRLLAGQSIDSREYVKRLALEEN